MKVFAIKNKYLSSIDNKWHNHTTKWYPTLGDAWQENELFERAHKDILESSSSACHKESKPSRRVIHHKKVYYHIPKDLPKGRYNCVLSVKENKTRLIVYLDREDIGLYKDEL